MFHHFITCLEGKSWWTEVVLLFVFHYNSLAAGVGQDQPAPVHGLNLSFAFPKGLMDFPPALLCCVIHDGFGWVELRQVVSFTLGCVIKARWSHLCWVVSFHFKS